MLCEMNRLLINTLDTHVIYLSFLQGSPEKSTFTNLSFINWNGVIPIPALSFSNTMREPKIISIGTVAK